MMRKVLIALVLVALCHLPINADTSAAGLIEDIYKSCLSQYSTSCVKPKALSWISNVINQDQIKISEDLVIVKTSDDVFTTEKRSTDPQVALYDKIDSFLSTHSIRLQLPKVLQSEEARSFIPPFYLKGGLAENLEVPLVEGNAVEGRGFVKKVMIPFLLGLKFKTTVLVPIALSLIALKTWKAMTLGLLSLVLTGAMVIFKFAKPKVVNYEVVHYPHHVDHHIDHAPHVHLPHPHHHVAFEPHSGWARSLDSQESAYNGHL